MSLISDKIEAAKARLLSSTISGKTYAGRLAAGGTAKAWDDAWLLLAEAKALADAPAPAPEPEPTPVPTPVPTPTPSSDNTVVVGATGAIIDAAGHKWTITTDGKVAVDGIADAVTSGVLRLAYESGKVWQENTNRLWWYKTQPSDTWLPQGGTATSPVPGEPAPAPAPAPVPDPAPAGYGWGFSAHALTSKLGTTAATYVPRLKAAGSRMIRDDIYPGTAQATYDRIFKLAADNGQRLVLIMWGGGAPPSPATFQAFAKTLVAYGKANYPGVLHAIEPANEPNTNALSSPAAYVIHHNAVYAGVKEADPSVKVWAAGTNGPATAWARDVISGGAKFDEWSCHPYPAFNAFPDAASMLRTDIHSGWSETFWKPDATGKTLEQMLASLGYLGPIHATEWGSPTHPGPSPECTPESVQADVWRLGYPMWRALARAGWLLYYTGQDDNTADTTNREFHFGAHRSDGIPKPIVAQMKLTAQPA